MRFILTGRNYDKSESNNPRHVSIVPWSKYLTADNNIINQTISSQKAFTKHQMSLTPLKGVKEKNIDKSDMIKSNPYFRHRSTYVSSHNAILPISVGHQNNRMKNRLRWKNRTAAIVPSNSNFGYIRIYFSLCDLN